MSLEKTLREIQGLLIVVQGGEKVTQDVMANIAGVNKRSMGDWMRGKTTPLGMPAILRLLASLPSEDRDRILKDWGSEQSSND